MLDTIGNRNYFTNVKLYWGSQSKDVISEMDSNVNAAELIPDRIVKLELYSSLSYPFFHGSVIYKDFRNNSVIRNMVDIPIVYGQVRFCVVNGSDMPGSDNVPEPVEGESFEEDVFVTGIDTVDDGHSDFVSVKIHFVSADYLKFISNMKGISTFEGFDKNTLPFKILVSKMFSAVGLGDRLDMESITVNTEVPYISTENDNLLTALDYVYRKIFDFDFENSDGKTYCRFVYDFTKRKYVLWKFEDVGTKDAVDTKLKNSAIRMIRENVSADACVGSGSTGLTARAFVKSSGNQSILFESLDDVRFIDYDYVKNEFKETKKEKNGDNFIDHDDEFDPDVKNKNSIVMENSRLFKENFYERTFTTSRQNGGLYDMFTEAIFNSSFVRANSEGSIGRRAGNSIILSFGSNDGTMYECVNGDYLVTALHSTYEKNGTYSTFRTEMDLYRPYFKVDTNKKKMFV